MKIAPQQAGFSHFIIPVVVFVLIGGIGYSVYQRQQSRDQEQRRQKATASSSLVDATNKKLESSAAVVPADTVVVESSSQAPAAAPASAAKSTNPAPAPSPEPSPAPLPAHDPNAKISVSFSSDYCMVTVSGPPGTIVYIGAENSSKGGGSPNTLPASGTITKSSGAIDGFSYRSFGAVFTESGPFNQVTYSSGVITGYSCPAI